MSLGRAVVETGRGRKLPSILAVGRGSLWGRVWVSAGAVTVCAERSAAGRGFFLLRAFVCAGLLFVADLFLEVRG